MTDIDIWVLGDMVTNFNILSFVAILFSVYIYEVKEFMKYYREQKQSWHRNYL